MASSDEDAGCNQINTPRLTLTNVRSNVGSLQLVSHRRGTCETETLSIDYKGNYQVDLCFLFPPNLGLQKDNKSHRLKTKGFVL